MADMRIPVDVVVLAAGRGTRLNSGTPKPLLPLAGEPLVAHVLSAAKRLRPRRIVVVVPPDAAAIEDAARASFAAAEFVVQPRPRGTADAAKRGMQTLGEDGAALIMCADAPLITAASLRRLRNAAASRLALLTFIAENPAGYGRIVREKNKVSAIVEDRDARGLQREIREVFAGTVAAPARFLKRHLARVRASSGAGGGGEMYLTDLAAACAQTAAAATIETEEAEAAGINTLSELASAESVLRRRRAEEILAKGARIVDPLRADFRGEVRVSRDVEIDVNVVLQNTVLARDAKIGAHCVLIDCKIGADARVEPFCHLHGADIGARCVVGPFARIRPRTRMDAEARAGNFVELKNARLGAGVRAGHLAYLGDAEIGANANIGAGVITCNYDGRRKHKTIIGADSFVGSDSQLVAPVRVGRGAYIAAGTTLTKDAPGGALTWSRTAQTSRRKKI